MGILDQKSDLSKYRKPFPKTDVSKQAKTESTGIDRNFGSKQPLDALLKATPDLSVNPTTPKKQGKDVNDLPTTPVKPGTDVTNTSSQLGRHTTSNIQIQPTTKIFERSGKDVNDLAPTPEKTIATTNPVIPTPDKQGKAVDVLPDTPDKTTETLKPNPNIPIKEGVSINPLAPTMQKTTPTLGLVDYFDNANADGFTANFSSTQYKTITGTPGDFKFNSPILNTQLGLVDYFNNANANGFTSNVASLELGQFKTITGTLGSLEFNSSVINTQLKNLELFSSVARGFTPNMGLLTSQEKSQFKGIQNGKFEYPDIVEGGKGKRLMSVPRTNTKFPGYAGIGSLDNQLGNGSPFSSLSGANTSQPSIGPFLTKGGEGGYNETQPYFPAGVESIDRLANRYTIGSTPLDGLYNQFSLREESFNSTPIKQPYILRGIQREGRVTNQRWGLGNFYASADAGELPAGAAGAVSYLEALDGGFIRGGISTALDRAIHDLGRIAKFQISPQGITFAAKQIGLQMSNPGVEKPLGVPTRFTRLWTPGNMLANVAGNAFGLHFKRHGIKPLGETNFNYEEVVKQRNNDTDNRIIKLKNELFAQPDALSSVRAALGFEGEVINTLSSVNPAEGAPGIAGPGSVYGLGKTTYLRSVNSQLGNNKESIHANVSTTQPQIGAQTETQAWEEIRTPIPGAPPPIPTVDQNKVKEYAVLSYGKLKKADTLKGASTDFNDFRQEIISENPRATFLGNTGNSGTNTPYSEYNLVKKFGMPDSGKSGVDRSNFLKPTGLSDNVNLFDLKFGDRVDNTFIDKEGVPQDFIKFWFAGPNIELDNTGDYVMMFRATLKGITDNFNSEWSPTKYIGRADPVYYHTGHSRNISFNFDVAANSKEELETNWRKLNYLTSYTAPSYNSSGRPVAPFMRITIGNMFQNTPGFITSINVTVPDTSPWEINLENDKMLKQLPHICNVQVSYTIVSDFRPEIGSRMYSLSKYGTNNATYREGNWLFDSVNSAADVRTFTPGRMEANRNAAAVKKSAEK